MTTPVKQTAGIGKGTPGPGRPKGVPNRITVAAKEAFALAFQGAGGVDEFVAWAKANRTEFYRLYSKLIPVDVTSGDKPLSATQVIVIGDKRIEF